MDACVVVVEADPLARARFARALTAEGFEVREACDAGACRSTLAVHAADLAVIDLDLPDTDGLSLVADLRERGDIGLIALSRQPAPARRIAALAAGCDDYIVKPAHLGELCARVRAVIRRGAPRARRLRFDLFTLDGQARTLAAGGRDVAVTRGEFTILHMLAEADGGALAREALARSVSRSADELDPRTVDALVRRIRRKLEAITAREIIATVPGVGYRLAVPVSHG